jgi:gamma-tubulin complex component 2
MRQCGKEIECPFAGPIPFGVEERDYAPLVLRAYRFASTTLLEHLMQHERLLERLSCLKNYFLLQQVCVL